MSNAEQALIQKFYTAFSNKDYATMAGCYHADATFKDEAFELKGKEIGAMWHMLCERGKDMKMTFEVKEQHGEIVAHWEPTYTFSQTGNKT
jgi:ketosteroid isomerase-like protein